MIKNKDATKVLVLGATGMLGNAMLRFFSASVGYEVLGSARSSGLLRHLPESVRDKVICGVDVENHDSLIRLFATAKPQIVINCIGLVKQLADANDPLSAIPLNSIFPHRLAQLCRVAGARLVHISTDCVFSGKAGMYRESDPSDAQDLYGMSKFLGEVDYPNAITLRTSIIGHELDSSQSLVEWFLAQDSNVNGYSKAIFSGLPTVELARVIRDFVIPFPELHVLYHVSAEPINKFDLLKLIAEVYGKVVDIKRDEKVVIDRSLNSSVFRRATGYEPPSWRKLITEMHDFS